MQEEHDAMVAKLNSSHDAEVAKLKAAQEAEVAKLVACHEEELEKRAAEVLEAKTYAQKVHRAHQFAKRDYERAKTSSALQAERMKEMVAAEKGWIDFLKEMDERLSRKFSFGCHPNLFFFGFCLILFASVSFRRDQPCFRCSGRRRFQSTSGIPGQGERNQSRRSRSSVGRRGLALLRPSPSCFGEQKEPAKLPICGGLLRRSLAG